MPEYKYIFFKEERWVRCMIIGEGDGHFLIAYKDPVSREYKEKLVPKDSIRY